jgi:hypothetical protein
MVVFMIEGALTGSNQVVDQKTLSTIIYFASFWLIYMFNVVFEPIIPNACLMFRCVLPNYYLPAVPEDANLNFVSRFVKYGMMDRKDNYLKPFVSLAILFGVSLMALNTSFAIYYNSTVYHYTYIAFGITGVVLSSVLTVVFACCHWEATGELDMGNLVAIIILSSISCLPSAVCFFTFNLWDNNLVVGHEYYSFQRNVFFTVQFAMPVLIGLIAGVYGIARCTNYCCTKIINQIPVEISAAQARAGNFEQIA